MDYALTYAAALVLTILVELGAARVLAPRAWRRLRVDVPLVNLLSHPLLTLLLRHLHPPLVLAEALVVALEGALYRGVSGLSAPRAWTLALVANLTSWFAGVLLGAS